MRMKKVFNNIIVISFIAGLFLSCNRKAAPSVSLGKGKGYDSATFDYIFVEAVKHKLMGNAGDAIKMFEQCIRLNPQSDAAYYQMAQIVMAAGDIGKGKNYALKALNIDKENFWYQMLLAGTYYQEKKIDSAIVYYEMAIRNNPQMDNLLLTLGNLYSENGKYDKAGSIFETLDKKYGINENSTLENVKNLMRAEKYDEALEKTLLLLESEPDKILYNGLLAEIYSGKGEKEKAMEVYGKLMENNPDNPETQLAVCDFLIGESKYEELIQLLNTVILNPKIAREDKIALFAKMIEVPALIQKHGKALQLSLMVLESQYKGDDIIVLLRPELLIKLEMLTEAANRLEEIILLSPGNYYAWEKLLLVYLQKKDFKMLEIKAEECALKFNRSFVAKILYASAANENKNYEIALEELRKAEILAGENKDMLMQILTTRADTYYRMGNFNEAFKTFDAAIAINNEDFTVLNNYAYYLAENNMRLKEAEEMAKKVIEAEKDNATFLDTYAWVLYKRGKFREAEKIMKVIIENENNQDAELNEHYGYILKKRNKCSTAIEQWNKALKLDSTKVHLIKEIENCKK